MEKYYLFVSKDEHKAYEQESWFEDEKQVLNDGRIMLPCERVDKFIATRNLHKVSGASVTYSGALCKAHDFKDRMKYVRSEHKPSPEKIEEIKKLPLTKLEDVSEIDNPDVHQWYEIGEDKYGRAMYCPKTNIKRTTTMGEFYQSATVD